MEGVECCRTLLKSQGCFRLLGNRGCWSATTGVAAVVAAAAEPALASRLLEEDDIKIFEDTSIFSIFG